MKKLVIINSEQFGYNNATFYYCKYLKEKYNITYISWNHELEKINLDNINIISVSRSGGIFRILRILRTIWKETRQNETIIFIKYFKLMSTLIRVMRFNNPMVLDIRTGSVAKRNVRRWMEDHFLKLEAKFFTNITVISNGLAKKLALDKVATILPLGADVISDKKKSFNKLRLIYVGTLHNRNIEKLVDGIALYYSKNKKDGDLSLTIVGDGFEDERGSLQSKIDNYGLDGVIMLVGWIPHVQLKEYFSEHNVGISYIPLTDYYDVQPSTKTLEYLMSGMPVIATKTSENALVINHENGVLIDETAEDIFRGIEEIKIHAETFSSEIIRKQSGCYSWKHIINDLDVYLGKLDA